MTGQPPRCAGSNVEPMKVVGNTPIATLYLNRLDGTKRPASFVFDSGGGAVILDESLADDLGLKSTGEAVEEDGARFAPANPPVVQFGSMVVSLSTSKAFLHLGKK